MKTKKWLKDVNLSNENSTQAIQADNVVEGILSILECDKLVIKQQGQMVEIDWGNGACYKVARLTYKGIVNSIILGH